MAPLNTDAMSGPRALLTDREREIIRGNDSDISDTYHYQTISRIRRPFKRLEDDIRVFETHDSLAAELRAIVCDGVDDDDEAAR